MTDERQQEEAAIAPDEELATSDAGEGFGARLADAREARGLAVDEVARLLNLRPAVIQALEEEAFDRLPGMAFARGYARSYARLLEMSDEEIQSGLARWRDPRDNGVLPISPGSVPVSRGLGGILHGHTGLVMTLLSILVAAVVAAVLLLLWPERENRGGLGTYDEILAGGESPEGAPSVPAPSPSERSDSPPPSWPELRTDGEIAPAVGQPPHESPVVQIGATAGEAASEAASAPAGEAVGVTREITPSVLDMPSVQATPAVERVRETFDDGRGIRVSTPGDDRLRLRFAEDCWVEIRDGDDRGVFSDLVRGGQRLEIDGKGPFRLLLGYAPGVEVVYNGEPVALDPHIRNDVASLVVGR